MPEEASPTRCGVVAIVGAPNAGKSTLVNRLVGQKIAPVTHKAQTTRAPLRGVAMRGETQLVLIDTPGVFAPRRRLDRAMVRAALAALQDADEIVHLVDASSPLVGEVSRAQRATEGGRRGRDASDAALSHRPPPPTPSAQGGGGRLSADAQRIEARLKELGRRAVLALNKVDAVARPTLLSLTEQLTSDNLYTEVFMISALTGDGVEDLARHLAKQAPPGPWLFPADQAADAPQRVLAADITREKLMLRLHEEVPYQAIVETEAWEEREDGSVRIEQTIYVARESQRRIAIGEKGQAVKAIGEAARRELEAMFGRRVHLFLHVKVRENWSEERARYSALGLDFDA